MPTTDLDIPILQYFFCSVEGATGMPPQPLDATPQQFAEAQRKEQQQDGDTKSTPLPKGVVLGPDGKPYVTNMPHVYIVRRMESDDEGASRPVKADINLQYICGASSYSTRRTLRLSTRRRRTRSLNMDSPTHNDSSISREAIPHPTDGN
ncbi:Flavin-linked sulfhydryl oxidase of the mitochondrial IMS [Vermiconidia calcicola]|uniref:Flavin-linked sulfhydryl oxidase of the mitochondrial IMS n=1 Tax=Vermiconidia calcicola TaxID=1690605 RepID=A0ACC3MYD0_9PEZI|nr:Flavin-linked sulfhydryl oxidase of the mitochondrial IMS [Vermiconidia calcicola]